MEFSNSLFNEIDLAKSYDVLVVGAGLFGCVVARSMVDQGKSVLVVERRNHIGGNCYTEQIEGINVHKYGAHIFRTSDKQIWDYINRFADFNNFVNSPIANFNGELYNLPFNMNTFYELWGVTTPQEAQAKIESQRIPCENPMNLEEHILSIAGKDIYEKLVKGYTEKQWGRGCDKLPPSIMRRIPFRFRFDNNYFNDRYQGIPVGGYTSMFEKMLDGADVVCGFDYLEHRNILSKLAGRIVYTGPIDEYYDYCFGALEYRSLRFEHKLLDESNYQGVAVVNYTDRETPYTRTIEHKHFEFIEDGPTVITWEYPCTWEIGVDPYYPMEDEINRMRYREYSQLASNEENVIFGGRLGEYKYYDMQDTIRSALQKVNC